MKVHGFFVECGLYSTVSDGDGEVKEVYLDAYLLDAPVDVVVPSVHVDDNLVGVDPVADTDTVIDVPAVVLEFNGELLREVAIETAEVHDSDDDSCR